MALSSRKLIQKRLDAARGYLLLSMPRQALDELRRIEEFPSCRFDLNLLRGEAYRDQQNYAAAMTAYSLARAARPENLQVLLGVAWCLKRLDQLAKAIETMEEARRFHPDEPIVNYNLACYFALAGDKPKALECLGRSLRMDPELVRLLADESDFDSLRSDPDFRFVTRTVANRD